jgi:hypothetical protein
MSPEDPIYPPNDSTQRQPGAADLFQSGFGQSDQTGQHDIFGAYGGYRPPEPQRGKLIAIFVGLGVLGLLIGVGAARLLGGDDDSPTITAGATPTAQPAITAAATTVPETTTDPSPSADPTPTKAADYHPIPADATSQKGLDFGFLTAVTSKDGVVELRFDRALFFTGQAAIDHNNGEPPDDDYLIQNTNPALRTFQLDPKASIIAANRLADQGITESRQTLTVDQFVRNAQSALSSGNEKLPVWLRHTDGLEGPVTALSEQYLP